MGQESFLEPYTAGKSRANTLLQDLQTTVSDTPPQVARLQKAQAQLTEWNLNVAEPEIALRRAIGDALSMNDMAALIRESRGEQFFTDLRNKIRAFVQLEERMLKSRRTRFNQLLGQGTANQTEIRQAMAWVEETNRVIALATAAQATVTEMDAELRGYLLAGDEAMLQPYESAQGRFADLLQQLRESVASNPQQVTRLDEIASIVQAWQAAEAVPAIALRKTIGNAKTMDDVSDMVATGEGKIYFEAFRQIMEEFRSIEQKLMVERSARNSQDFDTLMTMLPAAIAASVALAATLAWAIGANLSNWIKRTTQRMTSLAQGDLTSEIPGRERGDEIGDMARGLQVFRDALDRMKSIEARRELDQKAQSEVISVLNRGLADLAQGDFRTRIDMAFPSEFDQLRLDFNQTVATLHALVEEMTTVARSIEQGASSIDSATTDLARRSESQAASLEQTAAAMDEMTSSVQSAADSASDVARITGAARQQAEESGTVVTQAVDAMTAIERSASEISQIVTLIDDIAFQTNVLALNAGVEAARAGEQGKGFAVVAAEVRGLAQRSAEAATNIKELITKSSEDVGRGATLVADTGKALETISGGVSKIATLIEDIASGAAQQATGLREVNVGVSQIDRVTQENASMVDLASETTRSLMADSARLAELVQRFKLSGSHPAEAPTPEASWQSETAQPAALDSPHADRWDDLAVSF